MNAISLRVLIWLNIKETETWYWIEQKIIMKMIKKDWKSKQEIDRETDLKNEQIKRENMGGIDIRICLKKRNKD